jgi:uroporphyrinogen-III synthase
VTAAGAQSLDQVKVASIGPITSQTARSLEIEVAVEANPYTIDGLIIAIVNLLTSPQPPVPNP